MKKALAQFARWLSAQCGVVLVARPDERYIHSAHEFVRHVDKQPEPWEWKQRQALRALINRFPDAKVRDLNLAVEIAVQECSASKS